MRRIRAAFGLFILAYALPATGQTSCLPDYTALQTFVVVEPRAKNEFVAPLFSERPSGRFQTRVRLEGRTAADGTLQLSARFDPDFGGVSLPYNLYLVSVISGGQVLAWFDFTRACSSPGIGFYPGREIRLPPIKLIGGEPQTLQIMVWGRL